MRCVPTQKNPRVRTIIAALLIFGGISYAVPIVCGANGIVIGGALFQFITVAAVAAAIFFIVRYEMTHFVYLIRPRSDISENGMETAYAGTASPAGITRLPPDMLDFVVIRSQGSRAGGTECVLPLSDLVAVIPLKNPASDKKSIRNRYLADGYISYDYTLTLALPDPLALIFIDGSRFVGIFIEPDPSMRAFFLGLGKPGGDETGGTF